MANRNHNSQGINTWIGVKRSPTASQTMGFAQSSPRLKPYVITQVSMNFLRLPTVLWKRLFGLCSDLLRSQPASDLAFHRLRVVVRANVFKYFDGPGDIAL